MAPGAKVFRLPVTRSSKRMPNASTRSACWMVLLTQASPCMPIMPRFKRVAGRESTQPEQGQSHRGMGLFGKLRSSRMAPLNSTPRPARITGRLAALIISTACWISLGRAVGRAGNRASFIGFSRSSTRWQTSVRLWQYRPGLGRDVRCGQCKMPRASRARARGYR